METISIREKTTGVPLEKQKLAVCSGCRVEYPRQEMVYLHEGHHDNLHFFNGGLVCRPCARRNGVAY